MRTMRNRGRINHRAPLHLLCCRKGDRIWLKEKKMKKKLLRTRHFFSYLVNSLPFFFFFFTFSLTLPHVIGRMHTCINPQSQTATWCELKFIPCENILVLSPPRPNIHKACIIQALVVQEKMELRIHLMRMSHVKYDVFFHQKHKQTNNTNGALPAIKRIHCRVDV